MNRNQLKGIDNREHEEEGECEQGNQGTKRERKRVIK